MKFDISGAWHDAQSYLSNLVEWLFQAQHTITHKLWTLAVGGGAVYTSGSAYVEASGGSALDKFLNMLSNITMLEALSMIATILLIIERCFIVWAWWKRKQRGDYEAGKP